MGWRAFFRLAARDGLKGAHLVYRGRSIVYQPAAGSGGAHRPHRFRRVALLALAAVALLIVVIGWRSGWWRGRLAELPAADKGEVVRIVVESRDAGRLSTYLRGHAYRDAPDEYGWTALHWAAFTRDARMMELLQKSGASASARTSREWYIFPRGATPADVARLGAGWVAPSAARPSD